MFKPGQEEKEDSQETTKFLSKPSPVQQPIESFELDQLKHEEKESKVSTLSSFFQRNLGHNPLTGDYQCVYRKEND